MTATITISCDHPIPMEHPHPIRRPSGVCLDCRPVCGITEVVDTDEIDVALYQVRLKGWEVHAIETFCPRHSGAQALAGADR